MHESWGAHRPAPPLHVTVNATNNRINGYVYDANGNLTSPPGLSSVSYDVENRMMGAALISGGGESYAYGPDNTRVYKKKTDGSEWLYCYGVFGERLGTYPFAKTPSGLYGVYYIGAPSDSRVYFAGRLLTTTLVDRVGSVRLQSFVDPNADSAYYPWGEEYESRPEEQEKFATYFRDGATMMDYTRNRYYSSTLGRFLTADPYRNSAGPGDPGSWNRYAYVGNDPVNFNDPFGLDVCTVVEGGGLVCGLLENDAMRHLMDPLVGPLDKGGGGGGPKTDCNKLTANSSIPGLTYAVAQRIWADGKLSLVANGATIAALAAVTWQGESSFSLNPINNANINQKGVITSVDFGPFQINQHFHPNSNGSVWGTNGAGQVFNGNPDSNISFGISILEGLYKQYGNNAAGRYVGSLGYDSHGDPKLGQKREDAWNAEKGTLTELFSNKDCFHQ